LTFRSLHSIPLVFTTSGGMAPEQPLHWYLITCAPKKHFCAPVMHLCTAHICKMKIGCFLFQAYKH